jgi:osmotically-inducible protein OsmY
MGIAQSRKEANLAVEAIKELEGVKTIHSSLRIVKK